MMKPYRFAPDHFEQEGWRGQFDRMERWHQRALRALDPSQHRDPNEAMDFIYAFCQSTYHLRDWLQKSEAATKVELDVVMNTGGAPQTTPALKLCRDVCNGSKHFGLNREMSPTDHIGVMREYVPPSRGEAATSAPRLFVFEGQDGTVELRDIEDLMTECVEIWRRFCSSLT